MRKFKTEERLKKITTILKSRQFTLHVILENIHDPHNVSAIYRTCDAVGVPEVSLLYTKEEFPKISKISSASAMKWIESRKYSNTVECFNQLRNEGFKIYSTSLAENSKNIYELDLTEKIAFVMGNENRGVSDEAANHSDELIYIPMRGMIQSLNVSVATAVTLYEAQRQRVVKGMYDKHQISDERLNELIDDWCDR